MKKTIYSDIICLDARNLTEEAAAQIESINDVMLMLISEQSAPLLSRIKLSDVTVTLLSKNDTKLLCTNGQHTYTAGSTQKNIFLLVNGQLRFDPTVTAEEIESAIVGGIVNGQAIGSATQISALTGAGVQINGKVVVYPDGARLRSGNTAITMQECMMIPENAKLHILRRVMLEEGCAEILHKRAIKISCQNQIFVSNSDIALMASIYDGDPSSCIVVPDGYQLVPRGLTITRQNAITLQGQSFVYGTVYIHQVNHAHLSRLESLHVTGKVYLPVEQMDLWLPLIKGEPEWFPYEGELLLVDSTETISRLTAPKTIINNGALTFSKTLAPEHLKEHVKLFMNDGVMTALPDQIAALQDVLLNNGQITPTNTKHSDTSAKPQDPNFNQITDMTQYVL